MIIQRLLLCVALALGITITAKLPEAPQPKTLIFDFGGVVLKTDRLQAMKAIAHPSLAIVMLHHCVLNPEPVLRKRLFAFFAAVQPLNEGQIITHDEHGAPLPQLMLDWLQGTPTAELKGRMRLFLKNNPDFFSSAAEKRAVLSIANMMFTPKLFAKTRALIGETINFIKECKAQGYKIYGLTNWDGASLELLKVLYPMIFGPEGLFDGIVSSTDAGTVKPSPIPYRLLIDRYKLQPENCIFWDDLEANVTTAQSLGMHSFLVPKNPTADLMREQLSSCQAPMLSAIVH